MIEGIADFSPNALGELVSWLQPWFQDRDGGPKNAGNYYKVTKKLLVDTASPIVFTNINQKFTRLSLDWSGAMVDLTEEGILMARFNDAATAYSWRLVSPNGVGDAADMTAHGGGGTTAYAALGFFPTYSDGPAFSAGEATFPDYTDAASGVIDYKGTGHAVVPESVDGDVWGSGGFHAASGPLTKLSLYAFEANSGAFLVSKSFKAGSRFTLLGF